MPYPPRRTNFSWKLSGDHAETQPRHKSCPVRVVERARGAVDTCVDDRARSEIDVCLLVIYLDIGLVILPAQAEINREVGAQLVVVLHEDRGPILTLPPATGECALSFGGNRVVEKVVYRAVEVEPAECTVVSGVVSVLLVSKNLSADLQCLLSMLPGQIVAVCKRVDDAIAVDAPITSIAVRSRRGADVINSAGVLFAANDKCAEAGDELGSWNTEGRVCL